MINGTQEEHSAAVPQMQESHNTNTGVTSMELKNILAPRHFAVLTAVVTAVILVRQAWIDHKADKNIPGDRLTAVATATVTAVILARQAWIDRKAERQAKA